MREKEKYRKVRVLGRGVPSPTARCGSPTVVAEPSLTEDIRASGGNQDQGMIPMDSLGGNL